MINRQLVEFENRRWSARERKVFWDHRAALELVEEEPVLDLGGGDGILLNLLRERGFRDMMLLDISPVAVEEAHAKGLKAQVADITEPLPFADKSFGTVCAVAVLEHLYDPLQLLREMARVGRSLVLVIPNNHYWKDRLRMLQGKVPLLCKPRHGHVYWFNYFILKEMAETAGLDIDSILLGGFVRLGPIGGWLARIHPNLFAHSIAARLKP